MNGTASVVSFGTQSTAEEIEFSSVMSVGLLLVLNPTMVVMNAPRMMQ
jgi:hypothetical protein